jgi:hypothetical protein
VDPDPAFKFVVEPKFFFADGGITLGLPKIPYPFPNYLLLPNYLVLLFPGIIFILVYSPTFGLNCLSAPRVLVIESFTDIFFVKD